MKADNPGHREIYRFLDAHGVVDKDRASRGGARRATGRRERTRRGARLVLDLHGLTTPDAERLLRDHVLRSRRDGVKELLVVHGRGLHSQAGEGAVLKKLVCDMLDHELQCCVRSHRRAASRDGGEGATVVLLR